MIINPLTGRVEQETTGQILNDPRSPNEQPVEQGINGMNLSTEVNSEKTSPNKPPARIIDPMTGQVVFGTKPAGIINPISGQREVDPGKPDGMFSLMGQDIIEAGKEIGSAALDYAKEIGEAGLELGGPLKITKGLIDTITQTGAGAISWIPSKLAMLGTTGLGFTLKAGQMAEGEESIPTENIAKRATQVEEAVGGFLPNLLSGSENEIGLAGNKFISTVFEKGLAPITNAKEYYKSIGWPNFGNVISTAAELVLFDGIHKGVNVAKKQAGKLKTDLSKAESVTDLQDIINKTKVTALEQAKINREMLDVINPERMALLKNQHEGRLAEIKANESIPNKEKSKLIKKEKQEFKQTEIRAKKSIEELKKQEVFEEQAKKSDMSLEELIAERLEKNQQLLDAFEPIANSAMMEVRQMQRVPTLSELSQKSRGFEPGEIRKPDLGSEPKSAYQSMIDPLKNEKGSIDIEPLKKLFGKAPKASGVYNQFIKKGISAEDLMLSGVGTYLKDQGQKQVDWNQVKKIADEGGFDIKKKSLQDLPFALYMEYDKLHAKRNLGEPFTPQEQQRYTDLTNIVKNYDKYTQYKKYSLPGMKEETYSENLYKYDPKEGEYRESHWANQGKNVMAHDRRHERTVETKEGNKDVVYVEEMQSNWHRDGQREGYTSKVSKSEYNDLSKFAQQYGIKIRTKEGEYLPMREYNQLLNKAVELNDPVIEQKIIDYQGAPEKSKGIPDAPFKKTWPEMIMRDVIADAVNKGKDGITWSTGKIQTERWGGKEASKRDAIYDKHVPQFFEREFGVKPEKVETNKGQVVSVKNDAGTKTFYQIKNANGTMQPGVFINKDQAIIKVNTAPDIKQVWYVPITAKMRRLFGDKTFDAIDNLLLPLRNENGAIRIPTRRKALEEKIPESQRADIRKLGLIAEKQNKSFPEFLKERGLNPKEIHAMEKIYQLVKEENPAASMLEPVKHAPGDMTPFSLKPNEKRVNLGKDANKKILLGESDANAAFSAAPGRKGIASWFKPAEFMFDRYPQFRNLLDQAREAQSTIKNELKINAKHIEELYKEFSNKALREETGAYWHSFSILGRDAMKQMGVEIKADPKYKELKTKLEPKFKDLFDRINRQRVKLGKKPIKITEDYLSFFAKESLLQDFKNLIKGTESKAGYNNLVLDDLITINQRQAMNIKDSPAFAHIKREGLRKGVKLELDPLVIYSRYLNDSLRHIHMSPINAFLKELLTVELTDHKTGKTAIFSKERPNVAAELASWSNKIAGKDNLEVPPVFQKLLNRGMENLTAAQLFGNLRTAAVQSVALFPTAVKFGYGPTLKGIVETTYRRKNAPIEKSSALNTAVWDASIEDMGKAIAGTKYEKITGKAKEYTGWLMTSIDYLAREATFRTAWNSLEPLVKSGKLTEKEAIRRADSEVIRTQGSGDKVELSPIQRNVIGKMATQWQTFTINHMNFVAKDVLGIKNPELKPKETAVRVMRYIGGALAINALFEQGLGIQSPMPAPVQSIIRGLENNNPTSAIMLDTLKEISEAFPGGGSVKFGSNPLGPLVKHADDVAKALSGTTTFNEDMITKAMEGDRRAMSALAEILGKTFGVPGTAQAAKIERGLRRGESLPRAALGRIYNEGKNKSTGGELSSGLD